MRTWIVAAVLLLGCTTSKRKTIDAAVDSAPVDTLDAHVYLDAAWVCTPGGGACTKGPACGNGCCGDGEHCENGVCKCGTGPACETGDNCESGGPIAPNVGYCGFTCCGLVHGCPI